jgi:hypothetical protein
VPVAEVEGVVALRRIAGRLAEVLVVVLGVFNLVFVIARHRAGDVLEPPPGGGVRGVEVLQGGPLVLGVAQRKHRLRVEPVDQVAGGALPAGIGGAPAGVEVLVVGAAGDVTHGDHRERARPGLFVECAGGEGEQRDGAAQRRHRSAEGLVSCSDQ